MRKFFNYVLICIIIISSLGNGAAEVAAGSNIDYEYDVVIYGGTASGVAAAIAAGREGATVALFEPRDHLGGMVSGGLGATDKGYYPPDQTIGGISMEFFERVERYYNGNAKWAFEPHVAEQIFNDMINEAGVDVYYRHRLVENTGVETEGSVIKKICFENGNTARGKIFIDSSYEGDLMAQSGVSYTWGREGRNEYNESLAGVHSNSPNHNFNIFISPYDDEGNVYPEISTEPLAAPGSADKKIQAYNFRMCLTDKADNRILFTKPQNYNPKTYGLLQKYMELRPEINFGDLFIIDRMPNGKSDFNNKGPFSSNYIGHNYDYPDGDYATRERIWQEHIDYLQGLFYYLQNDTKVPSNVQTEARKWGLCKDEFTDTDNWTHQLYVREGRRMIGDFVMTQSDIWYGTKEDTIGLGCYPSDSHNVQRIIVDVGNGPQVKNEGNMEVSVPQPYQIPYRLLLPKQQEASNLLVTSSFSASHVAYSTLRMEPQYMIIGHAAGVAAKMAIDNNTSVQGINTFALTYKLYNQGARLDWPNRERNPVDTNITMWYTPKDGEKTIVTAIEDIDGVINGSFTASVDVVNNTDKDSLPAVFVEALYKDDQLMDISVEEKILPAGSPISFDFLPLSVNIPEEERGLYKIKVMTWDGMQSARPLIQPAVLRQSDPVTGIIDSSSGLIKYSANFTVESDAEFYNGTKAVGRETGATVELKFTGTSIEVYAKKMSNGGKFEMFIDGASKGIINTYSAEPLFQQKVFGISNLPYGWHTVRIVVLNAYIGLDYFYVDKDPVVNDTEYSIYTGENLSQADDSNNNSGRENAMKFRVTENGKISKVKMWIKGNKQAGQQFKATIFDVNADRPLWSETLTVAGNQGTWYEYTLPEPVPVSGREDQWYMVSFNGISASATVPFRNEAAIGGKIKDKIVVANPCGYIGAEGGGYPAYTAGGLPARPHPNSTYGIYVDVGFVAAAPGNTIEP